MFTKWRALSCQVVNVGLMITDKMLVIGCMEAVSTIEEAAKRVAVLAPPDVSTILFEYSDLQPKKEGKLSPQPLLKLLMVVRHGF